MNGQQDDMVNQNSLSYRWGGRGGNAALLVPIGLAFRGGVGAGSRLFGRGGSYGFKGLLNRGPLRIEWGWNGSQNVFRVGVGWPKSRQTNKLKSFIGHHHWDLN